MMAPWSRGEPMSSLEERVAYLEGRLGDHFAAVDDLRATTREFRGDLNRQLSDLRADVARESVDGRREVADLRSEMTREFVDVRGELTGLRNEMTPTNLRGEVTALRGEVTVLRGEVTTLRGEVTALRGEVTALGGEVTTVRDEMIREFADVRAGARRFEDQMHQQFRWLAGVQVTSLVAVGSAVVGLYFK